MSYPATFGTIGQPFILLSSVDSTNNYAMAQVQAGLAQHGAAFFALEQTAGKGQRGKSWQSTIGQNIMMSLVISPGGALAAKSFMLSATISLACYDFYKSLAGDETSIKWPNDIYWRDRKAGGILIENLFGAPDNSWKCAIAGMGININQVEFGEFATRAVSLKQITGKTAEIRDLALKLCDQVHARLAAFYDSRFDEILAEYNAVLFKRGSIVKLRRENTVFETTINSVDSFGRLHTKDSLPRSFGFGEVTWVL